MLNRKTGRAMTTVSATGAPPPFDLGRLIGQSAALVRDRWPTLLSIFAVGLAPRLALEALNHGNMLAYRYPSIFAGHAADRLGAALLAHATEAVLVAACFLPRTRDGVAGAFIAMLRANPVLIPAWAVCEIDTAVRLWDDWAVTTMPPGVLAVAPLVLIALDIGGAMVAVAMVGLFTPAVLFERLGLVDGLARAWRLMAGARGKLAALYLAVGAAVVFSVFPIGFLGWGLNHWRPGVGPPWLDNVSFAVAALVNCSWSVFIAAAYLEQRRLHEGVLPEEVAEIFA